MRDLIKSLIALAFVAGAFLVGNYVASDKCSTHIDELNTKSEMDKQLILHLQDSLSILKIELDNGKSKSNIDSLKPKQIVNKK